VLRDGDQDGLVVRRGVDTGHAVHTSREAGSDGRGQDTVDGRCVDTLEEREFRRVAGGGLRERVELLDDDVRVSRDVTARIDSLGSSEVVQVGVHEVARVQVANRHSDVERRVRLDRAKVLRERELRARHVGRRRNHAHWRGVARAAGDLRAVREGLVDRQAEVDEVVRRGRGGDLASRGIFLAVLCEAGCDDGRVESQRRLSGGTVAAAI